MMCFSLIQVVSLCVITMTSLGIADTKGLPTAPKVVQLNHPAAFREKSFKQFGGNKRCGSFSCLVL